MTTLTLAHATKNSIGNEWISLHRKAETARLAGQIDDAYNFLLGALEAAEQFDSYDPRLIITFDALAQVAEVRRNFAVAVTYVKWSIHLKLRVLGAGNRLVIGDVRKLVRLYVRLGNWERAKTFAELADVCRIEGPECAITCGQFPRANSSSIGASYA
ncbi:MAG TPA: hypothetical protein V6C97_36165 [Oculatellaceae cyanobacterium]